MMGFSLKTIRRFAPLGVLIISLILSACTTAIQDSAPELPKAEYLQPDNDLLQQDTTSMQSQAKANTRYSNFLKGLRHGLVMKTRLDAQLVIPRLILVNAQKANGVENRNDTWIWAYPINTDDRTINVRLEAEKQDSTVHWSVYLNSDGDFANLLFCEGSTGNKGKDGDWSYYGLDQQNDRAIRSHIRWRYEASDDMTLNLDLEKPVFGNEAMQITYYADSTSRQLQQFNADGFQNVNLRWNADTKAGSITDSGTTYCWAKDLTNTSCSD